SAGMMFALAIMDQLTPDDELHGSHVAGTGVVDVDGQVYPIGGIALKMLGARAAGADYFLAPVENCDEVLGHVPDGLDVYSVDTLDDAYAAIVAIGKKDTSVLPRCNADNNKG
ncbi:MAG: signal protein PDZ, partial [Demequina sp.]|nr:signal protein PDZ [Demequina sp.]